MHLSPLVLVSTGLLLLSSFSTAYVIPYSSDPKYHSHGESMPIEEMREIEHERSLGLSEALIRYRHRPSSFRQQTTSPGQSSSSDRSSGSGSGSSDHRSSGSMSGVNGMSPEAIRAGHSATDSSKTTTQRGKAQAAVPDGNAALGDSLAAAAAKDHRARGPMWSATVTREEEEYRLSQMLKWRGERSKLVQSLSGSGDEGVP